MALFLWPAHAAEVGIASTFTDREVACRVNGSYRIDPYKTWGVAIRGTKDEVCGRIVEITNLRTRRAVFAPVVDVGPCMSGNCPLRVQKRVADLLPEVRKAIGAWGLERVRVRVASRDRPRLAQR